MASSAEETTVAEGTIVRSLALLAGILLGLYQLWDSIAYYVELWRSLQSQGIGHLYLIIATALVFSHIPFTFLVASAFALGLLAANWEKLSKGQRLIWTPVSIGVALVVPQLIVGVWFIVLAFIHTLL